MLFVLCNVRSYEACSVHPVHDDSQRFCGYLSGSCVGVECNGRESSGESCGGGGDCHLDAVKSCLRDERVMIARLMVRSSYSTCE